MSSPVARTPESVSAALDALMIALTDPGQHSTQQSAAAWGLAIGMYLGFHKPSSALTLRDELMRRWAKALHQTIEDRERRTQYIADQILELMGSEE